MFYWIPANQNIKNFYKHSVRQAVREELSSLIGATVQAINIAIHDTTERKNPVSIDVFSTRLKQAAPNNKGGDG